MAQWWRICLPMQDTWVWFLGWEDPLEKEMATHSSVLVGRIPWTGEPSGLRFMQSQRSWTWLSNYNNSLICSESKTQGIGPRYLCFTEFSRHFWWMLQLADYCFWASPMFLYLRGRGMAARVFGWRVCVGGWVDFFSIDFLLVSQFLLKSHSCLR